MWEIRKSASRSEPVEGKLYRDRDDDLFFYLGSGTYEPWLEIKGNGAHRRDENYPNGPLTELDTEEYGEALIEKIRSY